MTNIESGAKRTPQSQQTPQVKFVAFESWRYQDPSDIVEASMRLTEKEERWAARGDRISHRPQRVRIWDEHYRQARRIHIKKLMKGRP